METKDYYSVVERNQHVYLMETKAVLYSVLPINISINCHFYCGQQLRYGANQTCVYKPVARIFARGLHGCLMCMYARVRVSEGILPQETLDALTLLLRSFWDRSRAVVALSICYIARRLFYSIFGCLRIC